MTIHIFNPEHDIALASGLANFTAPHAGRHLRHDLGYLPALWAADGDAIVVDDVETAARSWRRLAARIDGLGAGGHARRQLHFLSWKSALAVGPADGISPWGWDAALCAVLRRRGVSEEALPTDTALREIRQLSHRRLTAQLLPLLRQGLEEATVGQAYECRQAAETEPLVARYGRIVLKAPWSSSGRGLRFVQANDRQQNIGNWLRNVIAAQGSVMAEPYYNKVKDFAMEFHSDGLGTVTYQGLSLFHTQNGAYLGNIVATETAKRQLLSRYVALPLLDEVQRRLCSELGTLLSGRYAGELGVDMMVAGPPQSDPAQDGGNLRLHPCVEVNLRRTMGHAALTLTPPTDDDLRVMRVDYTNNSYKLKINRL